MNYLLHQENQHILLVMILMLTIAFVFGNLLSIAIVLVVVCMFLFFFRAPDIDRIKDATRKQPPNVFLSPCFGTVTDIIRDDDNDLVTISIFLSIFDIHSQYVPCNSVLKSATYKEGFFESAQLMRKTEKNERMIWEFNSHEFGVYKVEQIAGFIARAIVMFLPTKPGTKVKPGDELGMIRFGSRVTVTLDRKENLDVMVKIGQKVRGPFSVLAKKRSR